jgi:hypothetical protein
VTRKVPTRFVSTTSRNTSTGNSSNGPDTSGGALGWVSIPALFTTTVGTPQADTMRSKPASTLAWSVMSMATASRRPSWSSMPSRSAGSATSLREVTATRAPRSCSERTNSAPIWPKPPVTTTTLSRTEKSGSSPSDMYRYSK